MYEAGEVNWIRINNVGVEIERRGMMLYGTNKAEVVNVPLFSSVGRLVPFGSVQFGGRAMAEE